MAGKKLSYEIGVDPSKAIAGLKQFSGAAKKAMKDVDDSMEDTTTNAQKVAKALSGLADEIETEMKGAATAAEALGQALGPELAGRANVDQVVTDLRKMGLTFDEITADADTLAGALKKLDSVQVDTSGVDKLGGSVRNAKDDVDEVGKSAESSKNALANMVGNSVQDVTGLGGALGVAAGQLAEFAADAKFGGEGLASIGKNMLAVAGPIAAIITVTSSLSSIFKAAEERAQRLADTTDQLTTAMEGGTTAIADSMRENSAAMRDFDADARTAWGGFVEGAVGAANAIPLIGSLIPDDAFQNITDVLAVFSQLGITAFDIGKAFEGGRDDIGAYMTMLEIAEEQGKITNDQLAAGKQQLEVWAQAADQAGKSSGFFNTNVAELNQLIVDAADPLTQYADQWKIIMDDLRDGKVNFPATADAVNLLNKELGLTPDQIREIAQAGLDKIEEDNAAATEKHNAALKAQADKVKQSVKAMKDYQITVSKADAELLEMAGSFDQMATASDAMNKAFDLGNAPRDAAGEIRDIKLAIDGLSDVAKDVNVGAALKGSVKADDFLDALDALRPQIQAKITEAFSTGGEGEARATALRYIAEVTKELGGKFTPAQVAKMLGLENFEATIDIAIEQTAVDKARRQLEVLVGVGGETPYTASIALALDAGEITGEQAQSLIQPELDKAGVLVPLNLRVPTNQETIEAMLAAQRVINNQPPLTVQIKAQLKDVERVLGADAGTPSMPFPGGIVAERGAEIVRFPGQRRDVLVTSPSFVPPGTRVTSRRQTAHILRTRGTRGLRKYDSGGVVPSTAVTNNNHVTLNLPAGSNGADVVRQVSRWQRRNGTPL